MDNVLSRTALMEHILSLVDDPESRVKELGAVLEWDPSLSKSVTRQAALSYGLPVPSCTLNLALALLGSRVVKETVRFAITRRATQDLVMGVYDMEGTRAGASAADPAPGPVPELHCGALEEQIEAGLDLLTPDMRVVLALHYYEALPLATIARVLGRTVDDVKHLKEQALCRLSAVFAERQTDQREETRQ
ncbi:MAG TPA: sigma factor-like helix-turn-helix DNA-binding protein [Bacteroidota bacterium]|nr:sigma factor-like helix-turn-helix DNA-binding protein [Bacteroidota bacterium]